MRGDTCRRSSRLVFSRPEPFLTRSKPVRHRRSNVMLRPSGSPVQLASPATAHKPGSAISPDDQKLIVKSSCYSCVNQPQIEDGSVALGFARNDINPRT